MLSFFGGNGSGDILLSNVFFLTDNSSKPVGNIVQYSRTPELVLEFFDFSRASRLLSETGIDFRCRCKDLTHHPRASAHNGLLSWRLRRPKFQGNRKKKKSNNKF